MRDVLGHAQRGSGGSLGAFFRGAQSLHDVCGEHGAGLRGAHRALAYLFERLKSLVMEWCQRQHREILLCRRLELAVTMERARELECQSNRGLARHDAAPDFDRLAETALS